MIKDLTGFDDDKVEGREDMLNDNCHALV